jgi:hypothetical protein
MRRITMMDARANEKRNGFKPASQMAGLNRMFVRAGIALLAVTALSVMNVGVTLADDELPPPMTIGYQNGAITAIHEKTLAINGRSYGLTPDVVILNDRGGIMEPRDLVVSAEVKFHVTKEQSDKIDKMVVTSPR